MPTLIMSPLSSHLMYSVYIPGLVNSDLTLSLPVMTVRPHSTAVSWDLTFHLSSIYYTLDIFVDRQCKGSGFFY